MLFGPVFLLALAPAAPAASTQPLADPEKVVCRRISETGSRLGSSKICLTRAQWAEKQRLDQEEVKRLQANIGRCPGGQC